MRGSPRARPLREGGAEARGTTVRLGCPTCTTAHPRVTAAALTVLGPEIVEGPRGGVRGPRPGPRCGRAEESGLRPAHLPGQLAPLRQLLPSLLLPPELLGVGDLVGEDAGTGEAAPVKWKQQRPVAPSAPPAAPPPHAPSTGQLPPALPPPRGPAAPESVSPGPGAAQASPPNPRPNSTMVSGTPSSVSQAAGTSHSSTLTLASPARLVLRHTPPSGARR